MVSWDQTFEITPCCGSSEADTFEKWAFELMEGL